MTLLYPIEYKKPGVYTSFSGKSTPINQKETLPIVIGKGSKLIVKDEAVKRGYVYKEQALVILNSPVILKTKYPFVKDKKQITVFRDEEKFPYDMWSIVDSNTIAIKEHIPDSIYYIDYQSTSEEVEDRFYMDLYSFKTIGDTFGSNNYKENEDFYIKYFIDNITVNGDINEFDFKISSSYFSSLDYPYIQDYEGTSSILVKVSEDYNENVSVLAEVTRIEYYADKIDFIWLDIHYGNERSNLVVYNDGDFYSWKGLNFKIVGDNLHSKLVTRYNTYIESYGYNDIITFNVIASKKFIQAPARTVSVDVMSKGNQNYEKSIDNIDTYLSSNYSIEILDNSSHTSYSYVLRSLYSLFIDDSYNILFELKCANSSTYAIVPVTIEDGAVYLKDNFKIVSSEGISVTIYSSEQLALLTEDDLGIHDEEGNLLVVSSYDSKASYKFGKDVIKFDYVCENKSTPAEVLVSNTDSEKVEKILVYENSYQYYDGILAKLNLDTIQDGDSIKFDIKRDDFISWNITKVMEESFVSVLTDYSGDIDGNFSTKYVILNKVPLNDFELVANEDFDTKVVIKDGIAYLLIYRNGIPFEPHYGFSVRYRASSNSPKLGNNYYINASCIRESSLYNSLVVVSSKSEGESLLGPFDKNNDLYLANEVAWNYLSKDDCYGYIQIYDSDNDGKIDKSDFEKAIDFLFKYKKGTDIVAVNQFEHIDAFINRSIEQNDIWQSNEHKIWIGFPNDYEFKDKLSFSDIYSSYPFADFRVIVANDSCSIPISSISLTANVDGSFLAWALACYRHSSNTSFASSLIRVPLNFFSYIKTFNEAEELELSKYNMCYAINRTYNSYEIGEDFCNSGILEQIVDQQIYVCRYVRKSMDSLIGMDSESPELVLSAIQNKLLQTLRELVSQGRISKYLSEDRTPREIDANKDIFVKIGSKENQYLFGYSFYTKKGIKQLFGSYVIDRSWN